MDRKKTTVFDLPQIEREENYGVVLKYPCAIEWMHYFADRYEEEGNFEKAKEHRERAIRMAPIAIHGFLYEEEFEREIAKWTAIKEKMEQDQA